MAHFGTSRGSQTLLGALAHNARNEAPLQSGSLHHERHDAVTYLGLGAGLFAHHECLNRRRMETVRPNPILCGNPIIRTGTMPLLRFQSQQGPKNVPSIAQAYT